MQGLPWAGAGARWVGLRACPRLALIPAGVWYVACHIHNCSEQMPPAAGPLGRGSLTVQDAYIFFKVTASGRSAPCSHCGPQGS